MEERPEELKRESLDEQKRERYNAYMRDYMRGWRDKKKKEKEKELVNG